MHGTTPWITLHKICFFLAKHGRELVLGKANQPTFFALEKKRTVCIVLYHYIAPSKYYAFLNYMQILTRDQIFQFVANIRCILDDFSKQHVCKYILTAKCPYCKNNSKRPGLPQNKDYKNSLF